MNNIVLQNDLYYEKYLKYKTKYLKLKELLGGVTIQPYNKKDSKILKLQKIVTKLAVQLIIHRLLQKKLFYFNENNQKKAGITDNDIEKGKMYLLRQLKSSTTHPNLETYLHDELIKYYLEYIIPDYADSSQMKLLKISLQENGFVEKDVHISFKPYINPHLQYHITLQRKEFRDSNYEKLAYYDTEESVIEYFKSIANDIRSQRYGSQFILAVYAFIFGVKGNERNNFYDIDINPSNKEFLDMLFMFVDNIIHNYINFDDNYNSFISTKSYVDSIYSETIKKLEESKKDDKDVKVENSNQLSDDWESAFDEIDATQVVQVKKFINSKELDDKIDEINYELDYEKKKLLKKKVIEDIYTLLNLGDTPKIFLKQKPSNENETKEFIDNEIKIITNLKNGDDGYDDFKLKKNQLKQKE